MHNTVQDEIYWNRIFKCLFRCPECHRRELKISLSQCICTSCKTVFEYDDGVPVLLSREFRAKIHSIEKGLGSSITAKEEILKANIEFHNENAAGYDSDPAIHHLLSQSGKSLIRECLEVCRKKTRGTVWLDAGCGTGQVMSMAKHFPITIGFDISKGMLRIANSKGNRVFMGDGSCIPIVDETVDLVSACAVLHHLPEPEKFLNEAFRVLKPGGMIFTDFDPNNRSSHGSRFVKVLRKLYRHFRSPPASIHTKDNRTTTMSNLADYHMYHNYGFNGEYIERELLRIGFESIRVEYYFDKSGLDSRDRPPILLLIRRLLMIPPWKYISKKEFAPHFLILAKKP